MRAAGPRRSDSALRLAYAQIGATDFSRDLLERVPDRLGVSVLSDLEWSDLGTPERVLAVAQASGRRPTCTAPVEAGHAVLSRRSRPSHVAPPACSSIHLRRPKPLAHQRYVG
jgi:hypothetical protein